jgi:hypothetical protein
MRDAGRHALPAAATQILHRRHALCSSSPHRGPPARAFGTSAMQRCSSHGWMRYKLLRIKRRTLSAWAPLARGTSSPFLLPLMYKCRLSTWTWNTQCMRCRRSFPSDLEKWYGHAPLKRHVPSPASDVTSQPTSVAAAHCRRWPARTCFYAEAPQLAALRACRGAEDFFAAALLCMRCRVAAS